jgi:hypothetical protein
MGETEAWALGEPLADGPAQRLSSKILLSQSLNASKFEERPFGTRLSNQRLQFGTAESVVSPHAS